MADVTADLLKTQLRQLRLPTMGREFERLAEGHPDGDVLVYAMFKDDCKYLGLKR